MKTVILQLKKFVCTYALAGLALAKEITQTTGMTRWCVWEEKRAAGVPTRHALLAYAFARSMPYSALEARVRERNGPSVGQIEKILQEAGYPLKDGEVASWIQGVARAEAA